MQTALLALLIGTCFAGEPRIGVPYQQFRLDNGLNVILHQDKTTPMVTLNLWYHVGSGNEKPGRTGFAHLFEHILFEGSKNVPEGSFDGWLEAAGGNNNGSTTTDRTNYYETMPSNALELAFFLESDRMGFLLEAMSAGKLDGQRDVVKNERRQRYENAPYGLAFPTIVEQIYPKGHPYSWPTIGYMEDLSAASLDDVIGFFKTYYVPNNASMVIAGDFEVEPVKAMIQKWFGGIPAGAPVTPVSVAPVQLNEVKRVVLEDKVQLPRLYLVWPTPAAFQPGDAELDLAGSILSNGKNSRLYRRLVYDMQIAQDVAAFQYSGKLGSAFILFATARPGVDLNQIQKAIDEELELLKKQPPSEREVQRVVNGSEARLLDQMEQPEAKADLLNHYYFLTGNPDYFNEDLNRYKGVSGQDISTLMGKYLRADARLILSIVPTGAAGLAASANEGQP